jgi:3-oxoacyl-[acyl-carrier protein] reductase
VRVAAHGKRVHSVRADIRQELEVERLLAEVQQTLGPIDILVHNTDWDPVEDIDAIREDDFDAVLAVHLTSAFLLMRGVLPHMREQRWGRIIHVSSVAAHRGVGSLHYAAAKAGLEGLTRAVASRLSNEGVTANAVVPAPIGAPKNDESERSPHNVSRGTPEEVADAILLCAATSTMTGQTVYLSGGAFRG